MVNFNLRLRENVFGEWKNEYIDYAKLKRLVKKQEQLQSASRYFDTENSATPSNYGTMMAKNRITGVRRSRSTSFLHTLAAKAVDASEFQGLVSFPQSDPFEDALEAEYEKVEHAYKTHVAQYAQQLTLLQTQYRPNAPFTTQESLKYALVELHRLLMYLNNFALLNYKGFIKILRKHDRAIMPQASSTRGFGSSSISQGHRKDLHSYAFVEAHDCRDLQHQVEQTFANFFCEGNRSLAIATLITKKEEFVNWAQIYIGMKIGACIILIVWVVWDSLVVPTFKSSKERHIIPLAATRAYPVYRGIGCLLLLHWLVGLSLYVWSIARINYRYIFELDPRNTRQPAQVFSAATNMTIVFLVNLLLYYKVVNGYFPEEILHRGYYPLLLALYTFYFYIVRNWSRQRGLMRTVREIMASPFSSVTFFHVFVGNYLTSTIKVNQDLCWSLCYFATQEFLEKDVPPEEYALRLLQTESAAAINGTSSCQANVYYVNVVVPLICALPLWWRFQQNLRRIYDTKTWWPSLPNAFKYALAQVVALFGLFHPFYAGGREDHGASFRITWIVLFTLSALYTWAWDVTMDWGLGRPESKLRGYRQMFSRKWIYTVAVIADFFLCFAWTLSLIPHRGSSQEFLLYLQPFTMVAELFRRTMWSFFCLENEHLRNTHGFRQVDLIPLHCEQIGSVGNGADAEQKPLDPLGGWALLTNILLLTLAVVALSVAAIVIEK